MIILGLAALAACAGSAGEPAATSGPPTVTAAPSPTPFPISDGLFTSGAEAFLLSEDELAGLFRVVDAAVQTSNAEIPELRADGEAYLEATGRLDGWQLILLRGEGSEIGPNYIVSRTTTYESAEGAQLVLSREWQADVWTAIDSGALELLPQIEGLGAQHLVWRDPSTRAVGVQIVYRNLYLFFTGLSTGEDLYDFFADLAREHLDWIQSREQ